MSNSQLVRIVGACVVALALAGHLWMLDAPDLHGSSETAVAMDVMTSQEPLSLSGCPMDMSACQVPMPTDPPVALLLSVLLIAAVLTGRLLHDAHAVPARAGPPTERAPPPSPAVPSSVVLLV